MMSKAGYTVTADTGCSDWEARRHWRLVCELPKGTNAMTQPWVLIQEHATASVDARWLETHAGTSFRRRWPARTVPMSVQHLLWPPPPRRAPQRLLQLVFDEA